MGGRKPDRPLRVGHLSRAKATLFKIERLLVSNLAIDVASDGLKSVAIVADRAEAVPLTVRLRR